MKPSFEPTAADIGEPTFQPDVPGGFEVDLPGTSPLVATIDDTSELLEARAFESGREEGLASARTQCEPALRALSAAAAELSAQQHDYLRAQRRLLVGLAVEIAEHIVGRAISQNPELIIERIEGALAQTGPNSKSKIELSPTDHALVNESEVAPSLFDHVQLVANADLSAGEFMLRSESTTIDARWSSLRDGIREALVGLDSSTESNLESQNEGSGGTTA